MNKTFRWFVQLKPSRQLLLIFSIGFVIRLMLVIVIRQYQDLARYELERVAISLATLGTFANPYALPTGPTAHVSPGYPILLSWLFRIFGMGVAGEFVKQAFACAVTAAQAAILPLVARALGIDYRIGLAASVFSALLPIKFATQTMGDWEAPYTALFLMLIAVMTVKTWQQENFHLTRAVWTGVAWGFALLFVSAFLPLFLVLMAVGFLLISRRFWMPYVRFCAVQGLVALLLLTPWTVRNYYALGKPIVTRSNYGLELRISNNDIAGPNEAENFRQGVYHIYHPLQNPREALRVRELGEVEYNRLAEQEAKAWISSHPAHFLKLTALRIAWFWFFYDADHLMKFAALLLSALLGFVGLFYLWQRNPYSGTALGMVLLIFPLPNYLVHVGLRHKYPIDWILTLLTFYVLTIWLSKWKPQLRLFSDVPQTVS